MWLAFQHQSTTSNASPRVQDLGQFEESVRHASRASQAIFTLAGGEENLSSSTVQKAHSEIRKA